VGGGERHPWRRISGRIAKEDPAVNDTYITLGGNVVTEPRQYRSKDGTAAAYLRIASSPRIFDRRSETWRDGETAYYGVWCHRALAENVLRCVRQGHPIVVHGRLRVRSYEKEGQRRHSVEVDAAMLGHDLRRGVSEFGRVTEVQREDGQVMEVAADPALPSAA
jgi:single-strand DNA-binding protein